MRFIRRAQNLFFRVCQRFSYRIQRREFYNFDDVNLVQIDMSTFSRVPAKNRERYSEGICRNAQYPAGITYRFKTNASSLQLKVLYQKRINLLSMSSYESSCLDLYKRVEGEYIHVATFGPKTRASMVGELDLKRDDTGMEEYLLYLCSYARVEKIEVKANAAIEIEDPNEDCRSKMVVYGSSISQGCAASRPGLSYSNIVARKKDLAIVNLGFSESAYGEKHMADLLAEQAGDIYILEYDHNAGVEELCNTHYALYERIRRANPLSRIVLISRFSGGLSISEEEAALRRCIIKDTFTKALSEGDENIYFIDGGVLSEDTRKRMFVDDRHPNDDGMKLIAGLILEQVF